MHRQHLCATFVTSITFLSMLLNGGSDKGYVVSVIDELSIMDLYGLILLENQNTVTKTCPSATSFHNNHCVLFGSICKFLHLTGFTASRGACN